MAKNFIAELIRMVRSFAGSHGIFSAYHEVEILAALLAASFYGHRSLTIFTKLLILLVLAYILFPFDIIPDVIPMFGYADDIMLVRYLLSQMKKEVNDFRNWRQAHPNVDVYSPIIPENNG